MITSPANKMQKRAGVKRIQRKHRHRWGQAIRMGDNYEQLCLYVGCTGFRVTNGSGKVLEETE